MNADRPCRVLMVTQSSHLWSSNRPIYQAMAKDPRFKVDVLAVPNRQPGIATKFTFDPELHAGLNKLGIPFVDGYDPETEKFVDPAELEPDFTFLQTPYDQQRPDLCDINRLREFSKPIYIPYGLLLFGGALQDFVHPRPFFEQAWRVFAENVYLQAVMQRNTSCPAEKLPISGYVRHDYYLGERASGDHDARWNRPRSAESCRVIWNPRWSVHSGDSTFFDHFEALLEFAEREPRLDLVLRPHPLFFQNLEHFFSDKYAQVVSRLEAAEQAKILRIDREGDYFELFESSDAMISDGSTLIADYYPIGKPLIITVPADTLNVIGRALHSGCYHAANTEDLLSHLQRLLAREDPMQQTRLDLNRMLFPSLFTGTLASATVISCILDTFQQRKSP